MAENRPAVPEEIKRKVRRRCGFGCVICGCPFYHYDHMEEWAKTKEHNPATMTILCGKHHDEVTRKALPRGKVKRYNDKPFNLRQGLGHCSKYELHYDYTKEFQIILGDNQFNYTENALRLGNSLYVVIAEGHPLIEIVFEDEMLLLSCEFFDKDNKLVLKIEKNELIYSIERWDITYKAKHLKINNDSGDILLEIVFDTPSRLIIPKAKLYFYGIYLEIDEKGIKTASEVEIPTLRFDFDNPNYQPKLIRGTTFENLPCAILFGPRPVHVGRAGINFYDYVYTKETTLCAAE